MHNYSSTRPEGLPRKLRAGILGYTGYSGAELALWLSRHPSAEAVLLDHHRADGGSPERRPAPLDSNGAKPVPVIRWEPAAVRGEELDVVFTSTPPEVSLELAQEILAQGARVIDLSGAFRLPVAGQYRQWYGAEHTQPELLRQAVYGLPELYRDKIPTACLVANPGCYPTAAICALWPLVGQEWVDRGAGIVCDAKSGVTGAGKAPTPKTHFVQVSENFSAYAILRHRHVPEMLNSLGLNEAEFSFTAHLLPIQRGILATHYLRLTRAVAAEEVLQAYREAYPGARFIRLYPEGSQPQLSLVNGTNFCDIHCSLSSDGKRLVVISCIDNLVKGAAGQAIQNMNVMFGLEETAGLL